MKYPVSEKDIFPYRAKPFYFITTSDKDELTYDAMYKALSQLKDEGFGGIILFNKPESGFNEENFLSDEWFEMVENSAKACRALGLIMWINSDLDYPPGDVAGRVRKLAPHLKAKRIIMENGAPAVKDVEWGFPAFEEPLSAELFIKLVYEEYEKRLSRYFGDPIVGFFSDTDNRRVLPSVMYDPNSIMRNLFPWCSHFEKSFKENYGYDIMPYIPDIIERKDIDQAVDYWEHAGRTIHEWFRVQHEWLNAHGLLYTGHTSDTSPFLYDETARTSPLTEGRFSDLERHFDYPGTDQELYAIDSGKHLRPDLYYVPQVVWGAEQTTRKMKDFTQIRYDMRMKQASSTTYMYDRKGTMSEMFAASNFDVEPSTLLHIAAFQLMQGIDFVVVHQYQHLFRGKLKYFAPPDFSPCSMLSYSIKQINDEIAENAYMLSKGKPIFPVALVDATEWVWRNTLRTEEHFDAFEALNRLPYGFTICDTMHIIKGDYDFKAAVVAGFELPDDVMAQIKAKGITIITGKELDKLKDIIPECKVEYKGEGTPNFVRRMIDGEEFTFISNIEQTQPIRGTISCYGRTENIILYPGNICYISEKYDNFEKPVCEGKNAVKLQSDVNVTFDRKNIIPLEYFTCNGQPVVKTEDVTTLNFDFSVKDELSGVVLYVPKSVKDIVTEVKLNGTSIEAKDTKYFEEAYSVYSFPVLNRGDYTLTIAKNAPMKYWDYIAIEGDFDVDIKTQGDAKTAWNIYNLSLHIPRNAQVALSGRRTNLSADKSWALQGQPFYSGGATYEFTAQVDADGDYAIILPKLRDVVDISVNGNKAQRLIKPPYVSAVKLNKGQNKLFLTVYNSFGNAMEGYLEPSGIIEGCYIEKL